MTTQNPHIVAVSQSAEEKSSSSNKYDENDNDNNDPADSNEHWKTQPNNVCEKNVMKNYNKQSIQISMLCTVKQEDNIRRWIIREGDNARRYTVLFHGFVSFYITFCVGTDSLSLNKSLPVAIGSWDEISCVVTNCAVN